VKGTRYDPHNVTGKYVLRDHNHLRQGPPILFETMIFGGPYDQYMDRYCTWAEAEAGHARAVYKAADSVVPPAVVSRET
jgi:hypothetical protein